MATEAEAISQPSTADLESPGPGEAASLESVIAHAVELYGEAGAQLRDLGELAFMELDLAVSSLKWSLLTMLMLGAASIMTMTLLIVSVILLFLPQGVSAVSIVLLCALGSALTAAGFFLVLRVLTRRLYFSGLRSQLRDAPDDSVQ
jgi:hypothetical protein